MNDMLAFCIGILESLAEFLVTPPVFYIVGMILLLFVVKIIKLIIH